MSRLQDDLLQEFKEEKRMVEEQLGVFDPLGTELSKPAAKRLVSKGALIVAEVVCYLLSLGTIALVVAVGWVYPFTLLQQIRFKEEYASANINDIEAFVIVVYGLLVLIAILFFIVARTMRSIRLKNNILHLAGKNIKTLVGQHLKRKAAIDSISQRHFFESNAMTEGISKISVNEVPNPGYDENE